MPLNLASPGILVREVDLTIGGVDPTTDKIGGLVGPFEKGPVDVPTTVVSENDLVNKFGRPFDTDKQYESWMVASSYLAYGGQLSIVRADDKPLEASEGLRNGFVGTASSVKIKSVEHYDELGYADNAITGVTVAAKNPGTWSNDIRVAIIDSKADQIITLDSTTGLTVGAAVTQAVVENTVIRQLGAGKTEFMDGYYKGIITGIDDDNNTVDVKFLSNVSAGNTEYPKDYNSTYKFSVGAVTFPNSGAGTTSANITRGSLGSSAAAHNSNALVASYFNTKTGTLDQVGDAPLLAAGTEIGINTFGLSTLVGTSTHFCNIGNEIISLSGAAIGTGQITGVTRASEGTTAAEHVDGLPVKFFTKFVGVATVTTTINDSAGSVGLTTNLDATTKVNTGGLLKIGTEWLGVTAFYNGSISEKTATKSLDWFDQQTIATGTNTVGGASTLTTINWNTVADKPGTSDFASSRGSRFDEVHVVVIDGKGSVTGNAGTILEKHLNLSKAKDSEFSVGSPSYWRSYLETNSDYIFGGTGALIGTTKSGFEASNYVPFGDGTWDQNTEGKIFNVSGKQDLTLSGGLNYGGKADLTTAGALDSGLDDLIGGYGKFENDTTVDVDFLLMGSGKYGEDKTRALAEKLIAVADIRKDAVAFISPYRGSMISDTTDEGKATIEDDDTITQNVVDYYSTISSSSYAVFDSGYKYMYDRFNDKFRYVPLNGDIAGTCARTDINDFPWFSPAGTDRGAILNAVKLPYNPTKLQRDSLYSNRVNPVIFSPGSGIVLFGDKTGFAKRSAFDRINVRRLFIYLEDAISAAAKDLLFEFNDEITRSNFVNIVEPFLRDVQAKRGIQDYVVICDETNNTAAIIDANEFIADIYIKPARSINFIGLTFVATRTGVSFEEVIGSV